MNKIKFNLSRYQELADYVKEITSKTGNRPIRDNKYKEFMKLRVSVYSQIFYDRKKKYLTLLQEYLNGALNWFEFQEKFLDQHKKDVKLSNQTLQNIN